jgi:double-stranded uracil-DNA glycosylase
VIRPDTVDAVTRTPQRAGCEAANGHRAVEDWMGKAVVSLADLLRPGLRAVCVGLNPSPVSVDAGHYYQGRTGQRFFGRLRRAGLIPQRHDRFEDDAAFAQGVGFTDLVKRPTATAAELLSGELRFGCAAVERKIGSVRPDLVIFTFKRAAEAILGGLAGNGFQPGLEVGGCPVFVMPGPYEARDSVEARLAELRSWATSTG